MSDIDHSFFAPLARGLYLDAYGRGLVLTSTEETEAPRDALEAELPGDSAAASEDAAAKSVAASLSAWRAARGTGTVSMPGCLFLRSGGSGTAFWPGLGYDEARRRAATRDSSPLTLATRVAERGGSASRRSEVVAGRVALVTGGAQGFGEEITRGLVSSGALVFVADLNLEGAARLSAALNAAERRTVAIPAAVNVSDEASVAAMFALVAKEAGGIDLVVSNAGVLKASSVLDQEVGAFKFVTDVNYTGFFLVTKHAGLLLRRQSRSAQAWATDIIQINSKSGLQGSNKNGSYAGSKFGGLGLVQSFALELVEWRVKVNAICPGNFFDGPLWSDPEKGLFLQYLRSGKVPGARTVADVKAAYEAKVPMGRGCEGPDVMRAIYYLVEQEYETGQALPVTGGQVMLN
ncbi:MAG: SDR family NAD(P)-dependent oxidoreductase [Rectinemataceae bacterium]|jgi:sorbitol-6-phosphate 2-dehydrogenase